MRLWISIALLVWAVASVACNGDDDDKTKDAISVRGIFDKSGGTGEVGLPYWAGVMDQIAEINTAGGIKGHKVIMEGEMTWSPDPAPGGTWTGDGDWVDYAYVADRAKSAYNKWKSDPDWSSVVTVFGWGTGDTMALAPTVATDKMVYFSASYAGALAAPVPVAGTVNLGNNVTKTVNNAGNPYNFFAGLDYSTAIRWGIKFAKDQGAESLIFAGCTAGYCQEPIIAGRPYAESIGIAVPTVSDTDRQSGKPDAVVELNVADEQTAKDQMLVHIDTYKNAHGGETPDWIWVANTSKTAGWIIKGVAPTYPNIKFIVNVWGFDENLTKYCGDVCKADGPTTQRVFGIVNVRAYGDMEATAMQDVVNVHDKWRRAAGEDVSKYRDVRYIQGVVSFMVWKAAIERLDSQGQDLTSENVKGALETLRSYNVGGLLAGPVTYTSTDHRSTNRANIYAMDENGSLKFIQAVFADLDDTWLGW